jgi:hypothetical protein
MSKQNQCIRQSAAVLLAGLLAQAVTCIGAVETTNVFPDVRGTAAVAGPTVEVLRADWAEEYNRIDRLNPKGYRFPASQVYNTQAMALESDKSPVDVGIRLEAYPAVKAEAF